MSGGFEITGLEEVMATIEKLSTDACNDIVHDGLEAAGAVMIKSMAAAGSSAPGEVGEYLSQPEAWASTIKVTTQAQGTSGVLKVSPWYHLPEWHQGSGQKFVKMLTNKKGKLVKQFRGQSTTTRYRRYLEYLVKMMELGGAAQARNLGNEKPMTEGLQSGGPKAMDAFKEKCIEILHLD